MDPDLLRQRFGNLTIWREGDQRAPHKPLLLLYALGRCLRGEERLILFERIDEDLRRLLEEFGRPTKRLHPEYPFWRLQNDKLWEVHSREPMTTRESNTDPKKSELLNKHAVGGFLPEAHAALSSDKHLASELAQVLLNAHFPPTYHEDILQAVGIDLASPREAKAARNPEFRDRILRAYEYRCAVCGFDVRVGHLPVALEAAHIKWHQAGGPDVETNGIALCSLHHKLFDRGAFTLQEMKILVSEEAHGTNGFEQWLARFHGEMLRQPQRNRYGPDPRFTEWHVKEVFRGPFPALQPQLHRWAVQTRLRW